MKKYINIEKTIDGKTYVKTPMALINITNEVTNIQLSINKAKLSFTYMIYLHIYFKDDKSFINSLVYAKPFLGIKRAQKICNEISNQLYAEVVININEKTDGNKIGFI